MVGLIILAIIWLLIAPFFILAKIRWVEESISLRVAALNDRIDLLAGKARSAEGEAIVPSVVLPETSAEIPEEAPFFAAEEPVIEEHTLIEEHAPHVAEEVAVEEPVAGEPVIEETITVIEEEKIIEEPVILEETAAGKPVAEEPSALTVAVGRLYSWLLSEGNIWVCAGVLLFFVGFGLLFSYAVNTGMLTLEMRLAAAGVAGLCMTGFGFRMRERRRVYSLILQGGGMGVLYLVLTAATKFNSLSTGAPVLPGTAAIIGMLMLSVFTVLLALLQDYQPLALFAIVGGFAAPVLVSTGSRNYVAFFSVCTLMNLEILGISFHRRWRLLNWTGFLLSAGLAAAWGAREWKPEFFANIEPFLVIFAVIYTLISIRMARRAESPEEPGKAADIDLPLAVGVPFVFFFLQQRVVAHFTYGMAFSCLVLGFVYLLVGAWLKRREERYHGAISSLFIALCVLFSNLVVPYAFESVASSAIWAVEGAFLIVTAYRCGSYKVFLGGLVLHVGALLLYVFGWPNIYIASRLSPIFVSGVLFAFAGWISGFSMTRFYPRQEGILYDGWEQWLQNLFGPEGFHVRRFFSLIFTVTGSFWWWYAVYDQVPRLGIPWLTVFGVLCFTGMIGAFLADRLEWKAAFFLLAAPLVTGVLWSLSALPWGLTRLFMGLMRSSAGWRMIHGSLPVNALVYLGTMGLSFGLLRRRISNEPLMKAVCFVIVMTGMMLAQIGVYDLASSLSPDWRWFLAALPLLGLLGWFSGKSGDFVFQQYRAAVAWATTLPLLSVLSVFFQTLVRKGSGVNGIFIPVLNPLELFQAVVILSLGYWIKLFFTSDMRVRRWVRLATGGLFFVWISLVAARGTWWYLADTYYDMISVMNTSQYQGILSILWGVMGLAGILRGQMLHNRVLWRAGAGLLAMDMVKLLLVDLNRAETLTRILAFLVMGGLFLLIGWAAPLPPKESAAEEGQED